MKAFVHIGMHKTGTTSIQRTLAAMDPADPRYLLKQPSNHSSVVSLLFEDQAMQVPRLLQAGWTLAEVDARRAAWRQDLEKALESHTGEGVVFSAERLAVVSFDAAKRFRDFITSYCREVEIIAYIRPPISWMESAFQQSIKDRQNGFEALRWPNYRVVIEKYDTLFGKENVTPKIFLKEYLKDGDVVADFASHIGIDPPPPTEHRENTTLSLEALAFVYVRRRFGRPVDWRRPGAVAADKAFIERLRALGTRRFGLSPALATSILEANREDRAYIEQRLAMALPGPDESEAGTIGSEEDLVAAALSAVPLLDEIDPAGVGRGGDVSALAERLDGLFEASFGAPAARPPAPRRGVSAPEDAGPRKPSEEGRLLNRFARSLWLADTEEERPAEPAAQRAAWLEARPRYLSRARRTMAIMQKQGLRVGPATEGES